jgi:hypothetical protein
VTAGRVRSARLTDLAALGELSRVSQGVEGHREPLVRSLGLPFSTGNVSVFSLFRMPLGAFQAHDQLYVYEDERKLSGLLRVERDSRDEWTIVELDAIGQADSGDIRFRLLQHLVRDGSKRGAARFHVACADTSGNVELFMQVGFARYGEERIMFRQPDAAPVPAMSEGDVRRALIRPSTSLDALELARLYAAATPQPVVRLEAYRLPDWERQGKEWRIPRSALTPILRFADVEAYVQECPPGTDGTQLAAFAQVGIAKEEQPHYLRVISRPEHDPTALIRFGMGLIGEAARSGRLLRSGHRHDHGTIAPVRTYEAPLDRRLEEAGFASIANVSLLMKETLVRVAEPALVPAVR